MSSENITQRDSNKLRKKFKCFRVLILGRANAGKTTILQKVCNTDEQPEIFDSKGNKIDPAVIAPSANRGAHDIENEMIFKSNRGFVFHDSRGFESGGDSELRIVKNFIVRRARERKMENQLHAIWYCIPMDNSRPITAAENSFFSECGTGKVPVIAVFTKMDALDSKAFNKLVEQENMSRELAMQRAPGQSLLTAKSLYSTELVPKQHPPKGSVYIRDMNREGTECVELIKETSSVLHDGNLRLLLVSTQQVSVEICITYALRETLMEVIFECSSIKGRIFGLRDSTRFVPLHIQKAILSWFPHTFFRDFGDRFVVHLDLDRVDVDLGHFRRLREGEEEQWLSGSFISSEKIQSCLRSLTGGPPLEQQIACLGIALLVITEHSYFLWERERSNNPGCFTTAMNLYKNSTNSGNVIKVVNEVFKEDQRASFGSLPTSARRDARKGLTDMLLQIAIDNRLPKDSLEEEFKICKAADKKDWMD